jgi:predicted O-methyltransferase YrrM
MTEQELMYASDEDINIFHRATRGLPGVEGFSGTGFDADGQRIPYGVGPHSVRCFREIIQLTNPKHIFEVGFNIGGSSALWLNMSDADVVSIEISKKAETLRAIELLKQSFGDRIKVILEDSSKIVGKFDEWGIFLRNVGFDLAFLDGGHLYDDVMNDIALSLTLGIKWLAFDDVLPQFGPGVQPAIDKHPQLELVKVMGNIALYRNTEVA